MALGTQYTILLGYTIFLMVYFSFSAGIGVNYITGTIPVPQQPHCSMGVAIIDGLLDCAWQYLQPFLALFNLSSSIGLLNSIIIIPYLMFLGYLIIIIIRGG